MKRTNAESRPGGEVCRLKVGGMDCPTCEETVRKGLQNLPGLERLETSYFDTTLEAEGRHGEFSSEALVKKIRELGYRPEVVSRSVATPSAAKQGGGKISRFMIAGAVSLLMTLLSLILIMLGREGFLSSALLFTAIAVGGFSLFRKGIASIFRMSMDMNSLMTIAIFGAMFINELLEGAIVVILFAISEELERLSMDRSRRAITSLMELAPETAIIRKNGVDIEVPLGDVAIGEVMLIKPGARVPLDSTVLEGISSVDQSQVTGEARPVTREQGDYLYAGSINADGTLLARVEHIEADSTISRVVKLVKEAQKRKSPTERFIDTFASYYTPAAIAIAALIAVLPPLIFDGSWADWFYRAMVLLVIACPCALVISTPIGIVSGLTAAAYHGVLIKGGTHLEKTAGVRAVAFDKTGTLTLGRPSVEQISSYNGYGETDVLLLAASIERHSEHHLALALLNKAAAEHLTLREPLNVKAHPGRGVEGWIDDRRILIGSMRFMKESGICNHGDCAENAEGENYHTVLYVAENTTLIGSIVLADTIRPEAGSAIRSLSGADGIHTAMLTGDNRRVAAEVAQTLGIDDYFAELLPEDKLKAIHDLRESRGTLMMVGDGINDTPALAAADVGVAMGMAGTDIALETADITLMSDDLTRLPYIISHARRTMRIIRQNVGFSIFIKFAFVALAVSGFSSLWLAIMADMGLSLLVTANSLRLLRNHKPRHP